MWNGFCYTNLYFTIDIYNVEISLIVLSTKDVSMKTFFE